MKVTYFSSGYCKAHANIVNPNLKLKITRFYAVWALIQDESFGNILFDTGYSSHFFNATQNFPDRFYRWATPVTFDEDESAKSILNQIGIKVEDINYIIISHFHCDHIAGLLDFPFSKFICSKKAFSELKELSNFKAVKSGILKKLLPSDFEKRVLFVEDISTKIVDKSGLIFYELINFKALKLVLLPGHANEMLGFLINNQLFATDASWSLETFKKEILPNKIVKLFFNSWQDYIETQVKLRAFIIQNTKVEIFFTHCPETLKLIQNV